MWMTAKDGDGLTQEEMRWISAMTYLLEHTPDSLIATLLIDTGRGPRVITCDCCEHCAAEMVIGAAKAVMEDPDGDERPRFSSTEPSHLDS